MTRDLIEQGALARLHALGTHRGTLTDVPELGCALGDAHDVRSGDAALHARALIGGRAGPYHEEDPRDVRVSDLQGLLDAAREVERGP